MWKMVESMCMIFTLQYSTYLASITSGLLSSIKEGIFAYQKIASKLEIADALTKALPRQDFCRFREWMGVYDP